MSWRDRELRQYLQPLLPHSIIILLSLSLLGCPARVNSAGLVGTYRMQGDWGNSILLLRADGTWYERAILKDGQSVSVRGTWSAEPGLLGTTVARNRCILFGGDGAIESDGHCHDEVTQTLNRIALTVDPDLGMSYWKETAATRGRPARP